MNKILIVDNNPVIRKMLSSALEKKNTRLSVLKMSRL
jgi:CheY-like chemotaxis protein